MIRSAFTFGTLLFRFMVDNGLTAVELSSSGDSNSSKLIARSEYFGVGSSAGLLFSNAPGSKLRLGNV